MYCSKEMSNCYRIILGLFKTFGCITLKCFSLNSKSDST
uniref:Uncharacterized protein n=1 Tax=Anguilla anguilla TaxID=7936 RepID=A0A0E9TCR0_ANGAN